MASPLSFQGSETSDNMKTASPAFASHVAYKVKRELWSLPNVSDNTPLSLLSHGAGTSSLSEIASSEICGFTLDANDEAYSVLWVLPEGIDLGKDIDFRVLWSESGTGAAGSALWVVKYTPLTVETSAPAVGATALGTAITADTPSATANCLQWSPLGVLAGDVLTGTPGTDCLAIMTRVTLTTITDATAYQLQVGFERKYLG